jgi:hypothetical protein
MKRRIALRRIFGAVLLYIVIVSSGVLGYILSAYLMLLPLGTNATLNAMLQIAVRIVIFLLGLFWFYKLLRPYSVNLFLAPKAGENFLFDEGPGLFGGFRLKLTLSLIGSCVLFGFGVFGFMVFLVRLMFTP